MIYKQIKKKKIMISNHKSGSGVDINKRSTVNPLLSMLFMRMCFSTWNKFRELYLERIKNVKSKITTLQEFMILTSDEETDDEEYGKEDESTDEMKARNSPGAIEEEDEAQENDHNFEDVVDEYNIYHVKPRSNDHSPNEVFEEGEEGIHYQDGFVEEDEKQMDEGSSSKQKGSVPLPDTNQYEQELRNRPLRKDSIEHIEALIEADDNRVIRRRSIFSSTAKDFKKEQTEKGDKFGDSRPNSNQLRSNVVNLNIQNNIIINNNYFFGSPPPNIDEETLAMLGLQGISSRHTSKKSSEKLDDIKLN